MKRALKMSLIVMAACCVLEPLRSAEILQGSGATFPSPLYEKWASVYPRGKGGQVQYNPVGSGEGIKQVLEGKVDFGATDVAMTQDEKAEATGRVWHVPVTLGAVAIAFHVPGVAALRLTPGLISDIFLGNIRQWNDGRIVALNAGSRLPSLPITVCCREDSSGSTAVFTEYLSKVDESWRREVGEGKLVRFPLGRCVQGSDGMAALIQCTPGAVGYLESTHAMKYGLAMAAVQNRSGSFACPSLAAMHASAAQARFGGDLVASLTDREGRNAYPITTFSYLLVPEKYGQVNGDLVEFLRWALHEGQKYTVGLRYAPLPKALVKRIEQSEVGRVLWGKEAPLK